MAGVRAICDKQTSFSCQLYHIAGCFPGWNIIIVLVVFNMRLNNWPLLIQQERIHCLVNIKTNWKLHFLSSSVAYSCSSLWLRITKPNYNSTWHSKQVKKHYFQLPKRFSWQGEGGLGFTAFQNDIIKYVTCHLLQELHSHTTLK